MKFVDEQSKNEICTHVIVKNCIDDKIQNFFIYFHCLIDLDVFDKVFIDKFYAQKLNFELKFLKNFRIFEIFDEFEIVNEFIIHYVDVYFKIVVVRKNARLI